MQTLSFDDAKREQIADALSRCPLFRALPREHVASVVAAAEFVRFEPGEILLQQGEPSDSFLVLIIGEATVRVAAAGGEPVDVGLVGPSSSVGEVGLLLGEPRTATVVARGDVVALRFVEQAFRAMFDKIPGFGIGLAAGLAHRLHQLSGKVPLPRHEPRQAPSAEILALLPAAFLERQRVLPLAVTDNVLTLGVVDDPSSALLRAVREQLPGMEVRPVRIDVAWFNEVIGAHGGVKGWSASAAASPEAAPGSAPDSPRLTALLRRMVAEGASDLHLAGGYRPHWRIDGDIRPIRDAPVLGPEEVRDLLAPVLPARHVKAFDEDGDVDCAYSLPGVARFRVNLFRDRGGAGAALRLIPSKVLTLDQLGMPAVLKSLCEIPKGLVLVVGPTGCGKSTTLAAMLDHINRTRHLHVVTLEDPIEFVHEGAGSVVNQREVGSHTGSFARGLRAALREDPNVVLVGEMRDRETIALTLEAANTGHLVFGTLHTNSAISAVDRIIDQFPAEQQAQIRGVLSDTLRGVVAQTLCKRSGGGRLAVTEILVVNLAIANLIREQKLNQIPSAMQAGRAQGMCLFNDELTRHVDAHRIELAEALSKAVDKDDLARRFRSGLTLAVQGQALRVTDVTPGSPGAAAGFQRGDQIVDLGGRAIGAAELDAVRMAFRSDGSHVVTVERAGRRVRLTMELKRTPAGGGAPEASPPGGRAAIG